MRRILRSSLDYGLKNAPARWLMLASPFAGGVLFYAFYAMQPYLLELYGESGSYSIAGLAAAIVAGMQIVGGALVPRVSRLFRRRSSLLIAGTLASAAALALIGLRPGFGVVLALLCVWALIFAAVTPVRQALLNGLIPSEQRATVLSTDNLLSSSGGAVIQPALGRVADLWGYATSYLAAAAVELLALPLLVLARRERADSDSIAPGRTMGSAG
jgi:MFS family permease